MTEPIKLLLIEDDPDYRRLVEIQLGAACGPEWRFELEHADTLERGLAAIGPRTDLVLLDLTLPDSTGLETLDRVRDVAPGIPIVVLTNWCGEEAGLEAVARGAQDFLTKDRLEPRLLMRAVAFACERAKQWALIEEIVARAADAMVVVDQEGMVLLANPGAAALFGWRADDAARRQFAFPLEDGAEIVVAQGPGKPPRAAEMRVSRLDWRGKSSRLAVIRDVTAQRALEEIRSQIKERQQADRVKDETLLTVAHELRSPLTIIVSAVANVLDGLAGEMTGDQRRLLEIAARSSARISRYVDKMLDLARLESGKTKAAPQPINMAKVVEQTLEGIHVRTPTRRVGLTSDVPEGLPLAFADPDAAAQLLVNLVENALRYARDQVVVEVRLGRVQNDQPGIQVTVRDDGPGIAPERLPELFQRLHQLDRRGDGRYKGTGLGLSICRELAQANDGRVWAESEVGKGSSFHFALPVFTSSARLPRPGDTPRPGLAPKLM